MYDKQAHPAARIWSRQGRPGTTWRWFVLATLLLFPGHLWAQAGMRMENVTWVGGKTASATANCQALRDALATLPPFPRPDHLVILSAGFYDCGNTPLVVPPWVSIEGAGLDTRIFARVDSASVGAVALSYGTQLSRVWVSNKFPAPEKARIAISVASPVGGGPTTLTEITVTGGGVAEVRYSLYVDDHPVVVERGDYSGGQIRLVGSDSFTLFNAASVSVNADPGVTALCYFFRVGNPGGAGGIGNACPL